jgi:hypothetical protein
MGAVFAAAPSQRGHADVAGRKGRKANGDISRKAVRKLVKALTADALRAEMEGEFAYTRELAHQFLHDDLRDGQGKPLYFRHVTRVLIHRQGKTPRVELRSIPVRVRVSPELRLRMMESIWDRSGFVRRSEVALDGVTPFADLPRFFLPGHKKPETTAPQAELETNGHGNGHTNGQQRTH